MLREESIRSVMPCAEEKCGWWSIENSMCAILAMGEALQNNAFPLYTVNVSPVPNTEADVWTTWKPSGGNIDGS
jgi:hypothetical protein